MCLRSVDLSSDEPLRDIAQSHGGSKYLSVSIDAPYAGPTVRDEVIPRAQRRPVRKTWWGPSFRSQISAVADMAELRLCIVRLR